MLCFLCSYEKIFEHRLHYAHCIVCKCAWCDMRTERTNNNEIELQCFNTPTTPTMSTGIFSLFQCYFFPFKCVEYDLSLAQTHSQIQFYFQRDKRRIILCSEKPVFFEIFFVCLFVCFFFSVHGHVLWLSLRYAEGESRVCMCVSRFFGFL